MICAVAAPPDTSQLQWSLHKAILQFREHYCKIQDIWGLMHLSCLKVKWRIKPAQLRRRNKLHNGIGIHTLGPWGGCCCFWEKYCSREKILTKNILRSEMVASKQPERQCWLKQESTSSGVNTCTCCSNKRAVVHIETFSRLTGMYGSLLIAGHIFWPFFGHKQILPTKFSCFATRRSTVALFVQRHCHLKWSCLTSCDHTITCNTLQTKACNSLQYHAISCNIMCCKCNTM